MKAFQFIFQTLLKVWKTIGFFSEQYLESGHIHFNAISENYGYNKTSSTALGKIIENINALAILRYRRIVNS